MNYRDESIVPIDIDAVLTDDALRDLPDGPLKRFLGVLCHELDYDEGEPVPLLIVRRVAVPFDPNPRLS